MPITTDRILAVVSGLALAGVALAVIQPGVGFFGLVIAALLIAMPGLALILFREVLAAQPSFARGVAHTTSEGMIAAMGWVFLVGVPALVLFAFRATLGF